MWREKKKVQRWKRGGKGRSSGGVVTYLQRSGCYSVSYILCRERKKCMEGPLHLAAIKYPEKKMIGSWPCWVVCFERILQCVSMCTHTVQGQYMDTYAMQRHTASQGLEVSFLYFIFSPSSGCVVLLFIYIPRCRSGCFFGSSVALPGHRFPPFSNCITFALLLPAWANDNTSVVPQAKTGRCTFH